MQLLLRCRLLVMSCPMKQALRRYVNGKINAMSCTEVAKEGRDVCGQLLDWKPFQISRNVSVYVSFIGEVPTDVILDTCLAEGKNVFVPLIEKGEPMKMYQIRSKDDLEAVKVFKSVEILQPTRPHTRLEALESEALDLIIMPGVAFDEEGNRLGRGKGYYDQYLTRARAKFPNLKTVALAFSQQIVKVGEIPMAEHDQKVDHVFFPRV